MPVALLVVAPIIVEGPHAVRVFSPCAGRRLTVVTKRIDATRVDEAGIWASSSWSGAV